MSDATLELRDYVLVLRSRLGTVIVVTLVGLAVAVAFTVLSTPRYQAEAKVLVLPLANSLTSSPSTIQAFAPDMNTEREVARSARVASSVQRALGVTTSTQTLLKPLSVDIALDSDVLVIGYSAPDPNEAARLANAFAEGYLQSRKGILAGQLQQAVGSLQKRIEQTSAALTRVQNELAPSHDLTDIQRQSLKIEQLQYRAALSSEEAKLSDIQSTIDTTSGGQVIQSATSPTKPSSPNVFVDVALGLVGGLILGTAAAFLRDSLEDRIKDARELEQLLGVPVVGSIRRFSRERGARPTLVTHVDPQGSAAEAYRAMGTRVRHLFSHVQPFVLLMTSPTPEGGTSTTVANLGVVLAQAGERVLLLSADFRSPRLNEFFQLPNEPGLSSALSDSVDPHSLIRPTLIPNLTVVCAGRAPENPSLMGGARMREILESLRHDALDIILIDSSAALAVLDASFLGSLADGTVLICDARNVNARALEHSRKQLEASGAKISAAVYNFDRMKFRARSFLARNGHQARS